MPTLKEAAAKRQAYAWMIHKIMEEKELAATLRMKELRPRQAELKPVYEKYLELYNLHIKPLMREVNEFWDNTYELRKIEHFLQGQDEHRAGEAALPQVPKGASRFERLPYASKSSVGKKPTGDPEEAKAKAILDKIKDMDPNTFNRLLKEVNK